MFLFFAIYVRLHEQLSELFHRSQGARYSKTEKLVFDDASDQTVSLLMSLLISLS